MAEIHCYLNSECKYVGYLVNKGNFWKKLINFFSRIFFYKNVNCAHFLELVYCKNYFNLPKLFLLRLFKMVENITECSRFEQTSVIKFLLANHVKFTEIGVMCKVKYVLVKKIFTNGQKHGFVIMNLSWKDSSWSRNTMTVL